jgi:hypothetical protein
MSIETLPSGCIRTVRITSTLRLIIREIRSFMFGIRCHISHSASLEVIKLLSSHSSQCPNIHRMSCIATPNISTRDSLRINTHGLNYKRYSVSNRSINASTMKRLWRIGRSQHISSGAMLKNTVHFTWTQLASGLTIETERNSQRTTWKPSWINEVVMCIACNIIFVHIPSMSFHRAHAHIHVQTDNPRSVQPQDKLRTSAVAHVHAYHCIAYLQGNTNVVSARLASRFITTTLADYRVHMISTHMCRKNQSCVTGGVYHK